MRIPLSWLKEFISLPYTPDQLAKILTMAGLEVDAVETASVGFTRVVIGHVTKVEKHPNADKLCIANVSDGETSYQVVCGAPNCREGIKTALALVGATLTDENGKVFKVKKTTIRGVESSGMLCSEKELGLADNHDGIIEFSPQLQEGADLSELYADSIFEISLTPNLAHCSSVIGVVRELSAATGETIRYPEISIKEDTLLPIHSSVKVQVEDLEKCPRYDCRLIQGVKVAPSPSWLQDRLNACGIRPINNIVDITNLVLIEMGHPLHAFDFDLLHGHQIIVKNAVEGESFVTLDGKGRLLSSHDLMICDEVKPVAIAGVMGGLNSEVTDKTENILLEAAYFQPSAIRRTSKRLGLQTEASKRFERGTDPNILSKVLDRACMLIQKIAGGKIAVGVIDVKEAEFPEKIIHCRLSFLNNILGTRLSVSEVESIFNRLGMHSKWNGHDVFTVKVPTYRVDVLAEIDLIEEVARIYGYENIPRLPCRYGNSDLPDAPIFLLERETRSRLIGEGLQEFITCDLIGPTLSQIVQDKSTLEDSIIKVLNPNSLEQSMLRTSLLPGLLQLVKYNYDHQNHDVCGFEIGRIHFKQGDHYKEQSVVGIVLTGKNCPLDWSSKSRDFDFFDIKGIIENILFELGVENFFFKTNHLQTFHSGRQASIFVDSLEIGSFGEVHPAIQRRLDIPQRIYFAEFSLHDLHQVRKTDKKVTALPVYPCSERDWTVTLPEEISWQKILSAIRSIPSNLLESVSLLDIYRSDKIGKEQKNVTLHFIYRDNLKTISQEAVEAEHLRITEKSLESILKV